MSPRVVLGIDLGTTNTAVVHHATASPTARTVAELVPSAVAYVPSGRTLIGEEARARRIIDPRNTLLSTKRLIGAPFPSARARAFAEHHLYEVVAGASGRAAIRTRAGDVDPIDVAALVLESACARIGRDPREHGVVITVPAAFEERERAATIEAGRRVGFATVGLLSEPVATALSYLSRSSLRYAAVYDLGGGTFDLAVVDCRRYPFEVVAHAGAPYMGGDDVDRELAQRVAERVLAEHRWDLRTDPESFGRLIGACCAAKETLADQERAFVEIAEVDPSAPLGALRVAIERSELAALTSDFVRRTFSLCDLVLDEARITTREIDAVFLAGGSTRLPGLREMVGTYFGKRARFDLDPMHVVAIGASLAALRPDLSSLLAAAPT